MTIMASHSSASVREQASHATQTTRTSTTNNALTRRAQAILNDRSVDAESRTIIRYASEINDPWLAELVRRADAGEAIVVDAIDFSETPNSSTREEEKIEGLAEIICRAGDEAGTKSAALLVLISMLENATHPKALANMAKHVCFTR